MADVPRWHGFDDRDALAQGLTRRIADELSDAVERDGRALFGVSGGSTPVPVYRALSQTDLPWSKIDVLLVDERLVAPDHRDSNEAMVRRELLQNKAAGAGFIGLWSDAVDADHAAYVADRKLEGIGRMLDVALLGMGDDGHYASIFPAGRGVSAAAENTGPHHVIATFPDPLPPGAPHSRLTLSLYYLLRARQLLLAFTGDAKRAVYERALRETNSALPVSRLQDQAGSRLDVYWSA
jgi:6-phosphogluconolactonase